MAYWALLLIGLVLILAVGCGSLAKPSGWAAPAEGDGLLLAAHGDKLFALETGTLDPRWAFPGATGDDDIDPIALYGTPAVMNGTVFVPAYDGSLYALDAASGELRWQEPFDTDGPLVGGVAVSQDTVYFGSADRKVYAVDTESGKQRWAFRTGERVWSTPKLVGDTLYATSLDGRLYALDTSRGTELWSFKTDAGIAASPVVDEAAGLVYIGGFDSQLRAIDLEKHQQRWSLKADNWFWADPHLSGGVIYAGDVDGKVYAVDAETGERPWSKAFSAKSEVRSTAVTVADNLLVFDRDGHVYRLDPATGEAKSAAPLELGEDVLADPLVVAGEQAGQEHVLIVTTGGDLVRIDPATLTVVRRQALSGG